MFKHHRNDSAKHTDSKQTDLLILADLTELRDANSKVGERPVVNDLCEVLFVEAGDNLERRVCNSLCRPCVRICSEREFIAILRTCQDSGRRREDSKHSAPTRSQILCPRLYHLL